jgi:hypothetical protein
MVDAEMVEYDTHGCNKTIGQVWCDNQQICLIETDTPCKPIVPVTQVPEPQRGYPLGGIDVFEFVPKPACEPIFGKPWTCGGVTNFDRYDCIDGVVTLTEVNSTACGYPATDSDVVQPEPERKIPVLLIMALMGAGVLAYAIVKEK